MNIIIQINYIVNGNHSTQNGTFPLRGQKTEIIALNWWKQIKREVSYHAELIKVIVDSERDITQLVMDLENQKWKNAMNDNLPF